MNGSGSAGNPSAALSGALPAHADQGRLQSADWISESAEEEQQSTEAVSLSGSEKHQSPKEKLQSPTGKLQSPKEKLQSPTEKLQSPAEKKQKPQSPAKKHRKHRSSPEKHQKPQSPAETQQTEEEPDRPDHHQDPVTEKEKPEDSTASKDEPNPDHPEPEGPSPDQTKLDPLPVQQQKPGDRPPTEKPPPPKPHQPKPHQPDPLKPDQNKPADPPESKDEQDPHQEPEPEQEAKHEPDQKLKQEPEQERKQEPDQELKEEPEQEPKQEEKDEPDHKLKQEPAQERKQEPDQKTKQEPDQKPDPVCTDQDKTGDPPGPKHEQEPDQEPEQEAKDEPDQKLKQQPAQEPEQKQEPDQELKEEPEQDPDQKPKQEPEQDPKQEPHQKPDPVCTEQDKAGDPPGPKHEQEPDQEPKQEPDHSQDHQNLEELCLTQQKTEEEPPPPPPPPADQQNHLCPTTEASTLAPPLTIEAFCERPHPAVSSSGEPKLCGFLQKQGGPLRTWKQRWFTYEEKKNQLFYYRTPQDVMPLGRVELSGATFTYPLKAEKGTFHIKTPERSFILKAATQEVMLYWLQQLQVKRWQHRQASTCSDPTNNNNNNLADEFLPALKSPLGLVGEEAASMPTQRAPLADMSIKHPLIQIQNSVHSLRKRSSQEWSQSVFHVEAPPWIPPNAADTGNTATPPASRTPSESPTPPPALPLANQAGQVSPAEGRESPSLFDSRRRKTKARSTSTMLAHRRDTMTSSDRASRLQQENHMLMEEVKAQKELVWILHKALEAAQLEKRTCAEFLAVEGEQERLELLRHRERQAADLRGRLERAEAEAEAARASQAERDAQLAELQENIRMLKEKNDAKREVIIKLSDQVTACLSDPRRPESPSGSALDSQTFRQLQHEMENLKDDIEAYKTQNKFLNSEIYQLTKLWRNSSEQEKSLMVKCAYLEATNCQVESRYLGVLQKLQETKSLDPAQREAVRKMVEDALKGELKSVMKVSTNRDHDEYGFKIIPDYEVEDMKLLAKIQALEIRSHNLLHQEAVDRPVLSRWAQYLAGRSDEDLCSSPELKVLVRGGVPQEYRDRVWRWVVRARTRTIRERHPQRYQQLCEKSRTSHHPASRQIQLDLHRTLTTNQNFSSPSSPALQQLRRILLAFSWQNPAIGYCQGLNRLAAIALLVLQSEEDAFWCLVAVVEAIMPQDYYTKNLVASQADQRVLKDFMAEKLPRLAAHFEDYSIDVSLITFNWFLVVFVESLPSDILLPLWDAFLYEGTKVMFRYALALFKYKEDDILKIHDSVEIYRYLRFFTKTISDSRRLTNIAFSVMNPFPRRLLRNRRALHLERLQGELRELEEQQREFVTESAERKDKDVDTMVSEDDDEF